ncbi:MAG: hypothetical protein KAS16_02520 [Thermoplasmata archaeon]|nr:hypothetical protein [Thermoplasmata archaeon]
MNSLDEEPGKVIGILTEDSRLFFDLVKEFRKRKLAFRSLIFGERTPMDIGVILTSQADIGRINFNKVVVIDHLDIYMGIRKAFQELSGMKPFEEMIIGVDPGKEPGIAVLSNDVLIESHKARGQMKCATIILHMLESYSYEKSKLRIGHGAPQSRDEILNLVADAFDTVEIINEFRTTKLTNNAESDVDAAINIARSGRCIRTLP